MQPSVRDPQHPRRDLRLRLADQVQVMGGDHHGLAHPVQLDEQRQQPQRHLPVEVAGRLVGDDHLGRHHHRTGERRPLPLAARQLRRQRARLCAQPDPGQQLAQLGAVDRAAGHGQRQRDVLGHRQVVEELAILMHDADLLPHMGDVVARHHAHILPEQVQIAGRGQHLGVAQLEKAGLARPGRPGEKMERSGHQLQRHLGNELAPAVAHGDILQLDHCTAPSSGGTGTELSSERKPLDIGQALATTYAEELPEWLVTAGWERACG
ncbi:hypothetical protein SDC9_16980 [bioreactor metagenome]|uniref:Uncharacterized protein n=1 Tax=bioreactor metagenome TaxID=1076179 RepID=A0A644TXN6_9ZZZZ